MIDYIKEKKIKSIIDMGCGNGRDTYTLGKYCKVTGIDNSCKPNNVENVTFIRGNFCEIDLHGFDMVYSRFTFHSIKDE
jgi:ubiquinone/menaquinone biosynthesis C-methylase UbiE